jgi:hypothetical protein
MELKNVPWVNIKEKMQLLRRKIGKFKISPDCSSIKTSGEYEATQVQEGCNRETKRVLVLLVFFPYKDLLRELYNDLFRLLEIVEQMAIGTVNMHLQRCSRNMTYF